MLAAGLVQAQPAAQEPPTPPAGPAPSPVILPPAEPAPEIAPPPVESTPKPSRAAKPAEAAKSEPVEAAPPQVRQRHGAAIIQALDKVTAETMRFEARVGHPVRYKGLVFTVRACETTAPDEPMPDSLALVEVRDEPKSADSEDQPSHQVFSGWMFASSPGLAPLQHPVYDAWLIACKA
jgi:hypothetical protein